MRKEWFASWFDSPYYHTLYQKYNEQDAKIFLNNLIRYLTPLVVSSFEHNEKADISQLKILDLACGKGRHSIYLAKRGFDVTGLDLSRKSIKYAQQYESDTLSFFEHDMRKPFRINYFDIILNAFTSFGYFDKDEDNILALKNVHHGLKDNGLFILDYFNSSWVKDTLNTDYHQVASGIDFHIQKYIENGHVYKNIEFEAKGKQYHFQEKVRLFTLNEFESLFQKANLTIFEKFGDYPLNPFDETQSKRLILLAKKT